MNALTLIISTVIQGLHKPLTKPFVLIREGNGLLFNVL